MNIIPATYDRHQPSYQELNVQLSNARKRAAFLEEENKILRRKLQWQEQLDRVPNAILSTGERTTLRVTMQQINEKEPDEYGYYFLDLWKIGQNSGQSSGTIGKHLKQCAARAHLFDRYERKVPDASTETGYQTEIWVKPDFPLIARPPRYTASKERNHGGDRKTCPCCQSKRIRKKTTYTCMDCGTIFEEKITDYEDDEPQNQVDSENNSPPNTDISSRINLIHQNQKEKGDQVELEEQPTTPPYAPDPLPALPQAALNEQEKEERCRNTIQLLLEMAGNANEHVIMPGLSGKKYTTIHRSLTAADIKDHLIGIKTIGAALHHADLTTRALCFDTDDNPTDSVTFQQVQEAAALLVARGYKPLLEPSPAGRGGHLWIIFSERVNARAAYKTVCEIAPALKEIVEYWPGRGNQKVRLLAGKYVTPALTAWTAVRDTRGDIIKTQDLLDWQTPACLIPALVPVEDKPEPGRARHRAEKEDHGATAPHRLRTPDDHHRTKYGNHSMWVEWPSEQYLIDRFNQEHTIDELATYERGGMINASIIGRPERTASVAVTRDGERFTDFGAAARKADGSQDGGDAFEFYIRSRNLNKKDALRELGQALNKEASTEILRAGRAGEALPPWIMEILTQPGREVYNENALRRGHRTLEEHNAGGLVGYS